MDMTSFTNRLSDDGLVIFLFHGVIPRHEHAIRNANRKHVSRGEFASVLGALGERGVPLAMDEVLAHLTARVPFPPRSFAVTFDDGFENNASVAAPILDAYGIPATFYLTTSWMGTAERSWVDRIEACMEHARSGTIQLPWEAKERQFAGVEECIEILGRIRARAKSDRSIDRDALASSVYAQCRVREEDTWSDSLDRKLSWEQVRALVTHPLFTVGGHTHTHAMLSFCDPAALEEEIVTSVQVLHERSGVMVRHFAYPEGLEHHYNDDVIARLKAHGVVCCPTAIDGVNTCETDPFHLRRVPVMWNSTTASAGVGM